MYVNVIRLKINPQEKADWSGVLTRVSLGRVLQGIVTPLAFSAAHARDASQRFSHLTQDAQSRPMISRGRVGSWTLSRRVASSRFHPRLTNFSVRSDLDCGHVITGTMWSRNFSQCASVLARRTTSYREATRLNALTARVDISSVPPYPVRATLACPL